VLTVLLIVYFMLPGLPNGIGVMRFPDSSRYEGEFMQARKRRRRITVTSSLFIYPEIAEK
jgi:hypothetical protein